MFTAIGPIPEVIVTLVLGDQLTSNASPVWSVIVLVLMIVIVILSLVFKDKMIYWIFKPKKEVDGNMSAEEPIAENNVTADNTEAKDKNDKATDNNEKEKRN